MAGARTAVLGRAHRVHAFGRFPSRSQRHRARHDAHRHEGAPLRVATVACDFPRARGGSRARRGCAVLRTWWHRLAQRSRCGPRPVPAWTQSRREHDHDAGGLAAAIAAARPRRSARVVAKARPGPAGACARKALDQAADSRSLSEPRVFPRRAAGNRSDRASAGRQSAFGPVAAGEPRHRGVAAGAERQPGPGCNACLQPRAHRGRGDELR